MRYVPVRSLSVAALTLDTENPRFEPVDNTHESILALLEVDGEKLFVLARDLLLNGPSPAELPMVFKSDAGNWVVLEGNRRVAALKLLHNPEIIAEHYLYPRFRRLATSGQAVKKIDCAVLTSREAAKLWIDRRHTGENKGAGVVPWNAESTERFRGGNRQTERAVKYIALLARLFPASAELQANIAKARRIRITTVGRVVNDPLFISTFRVSYGDKSAEMQIPEEQIYIVAQKIFHDISTTLTVTGLKTKPQRSAYIESLVALLGGEVGSPPQDDPTTERTAQANSDSNSDSGSSKDDPTTEPGYDDLDDPSENPALDDRSGAAETTLTDDPDNGTNEDLETDGNDDETSRSPRRQRPSVAKKLFQGVVIRHLSLRVRDVVKEAQRLGFDDYPNVGSVLIRVILDLASADACLQLNLRRNQQEFKDRLGTCLNQLDPELKPLRRATSEQGLLAPKTMHSFIHDPHLSPTPNEVRSISSAYTPFLVKLDAYVGSRRT